MKVGISLKIDVTKILKDRLFEGKKGTYIDLQTFVDIDDVDQYGNSGFISHSPTKEERESKTHTDIVGNSRVFWKDIPDQQRAQEYSKGTEQAKAAMAPVDDFEDSIPF